MFFWLSCLLGALLLWWLRGAGADDCLGPLSCLLCVMLLPDVSW
jgi:hypothetical protein